MGGFMNSLWALFHNTGSRRLGGTINPMGWTWRAILFLTGILFLVWAYYRFIEGKIFIGTNYKGQPIWIGCAMAFGIVLCCAALLPNGEWVYRHITTKRKRKREHHAG